MDHKPLVSIFKKDVAMLSQHIQHILLKIHQYSVQIMYKPGPDIFIADWLSRHNHIEGKDKPIEGMDVQMDMMQSKQTCWSVYPWQRFNKHQHRTTIFNN